MHFCRIIFKPHNSLNNFSNFNSITNFNYWDRLILRDIYFWEICSQISAIKTQIPLHKKWGEKRKWGFLFHFIHPSQDSQHKTPKTGSQIVWKSPSQPLHTRIQIFLNLLYKSLISNSTKSSVVFCFHHWTRRNCYSHNY